MHRSVSNPSLLSKTHPKNPTLGIPRNVSVPVSLADFVNDIYLEYQVECVTHSTGYMAGLCSHQHNFPMDLINGNVVDKESIEVVGACLASPPDGECTKSQDEEDEQITYVLRDVRRRKDSRKMHIKKNYNS